jgi:hypothetical protein
LQNQFLLETANKLNDALAQISKLRKVITDMELKHKIEVENVRSCGCKSNNEIEILQDRLEQGKAASLKTAVNKLNQELKYTT